MGAVNSPLSVTSHFSSLCEKVEVSWPGTSEDQEDLSSLFPSSGTLLWATSLSWVPV